jgi:hypothetical protein
MTVTITSEFSCRRDDIDLIQRKFGFIKNGHSQSEVVTEYIDIRFLAEGRHVKGRIVERIVQGNNMTSGELLVQFLLGIRHVQSIGIRLAKRCTEEDLRYWAHSFLYPSTSVSQDVIPVVELLPARLAALVPTDLHTVVHARDILGYIALSRAPDSVVELPCRPMTSRLVSVGSLKEGLSLIRESKLRDSQRLSVYERILGSSPFGELDSDPIDICFLSRFTKIVFQGKSCEFQARQLARKFFHRVVLHDFDETLFKLLRLMDQQLADSLSLKQVEPLWQSVMACTLGDDDLKRLWDLALISPPELLVRVVAFGLVDLRDHIMEYPDAVLVMGDLVEDFNSIIALANHV